MKGTSQTHGVSSDRAIYPSSRINGYVVILVTQKVLLAFSIFILYDLLKVIHVVKLLFFMKLISSACLIVIQKPFSAGKRLTKRQWVRILRHAIVSCIINMLWLFGLTQCGSLRTVLLTEHKDVLVIAGASAIFAGSGGHSKFRGAVCFLVGVTSLLLLDHDDADLTPTEHPEGFQHHGISHVFYYAVSWLGLADHKAGVLLLFIVLTLQTVFNAAARRLAVDVGGAKRLNALSSLSSVMLLFPWTVILQFVDGTSPTSWMDLLGPVLLTGILIYVLDYYIEAVCSARLEAPRCAQLGSLVTFVAALLIAWIWSGKTPWVLSSHLITSQTEHPLSGGVVFSFAMLTGATVILSSPSSKGSKCTFVGYSAAGLPLYSFSGESIQSPSHSFLVSVKHGLKQILEESDSRKIFYFLILNIIFTVVELLYGIWTNSLGLISDGFHMMFDCSALVMGLCAAILSRKKATKTFPFGYGRVQVLSGFINSLFLVVVAFMVFSEALSRIFDPPEVLTERLLTVSVAGLIVNLLGIWAFRNSHSHSHSHSHVVPNAHHHGHSHGHSHSDANMQGVFLHILADTLGSVGVIISSLLLENFGWLIADPICSLFIAMLIFLSVLPLLKHSSLGLLLRTPVGMEKSIAAALTKVLSVDGVLSYREQRFWSHTPEIMAGSIHVQVRVDVSEQKVISQVTSIFKELGFVHFSVQVEKDEFFHHMSGISSNYRQIAPSTVTFSNINTSDKSTHVVKAI